MEDRPHAPPPLTPGMSIDDALALLADGHGTLIRRWAAEIGGADSPTAIHQTRVACRKLRSILAVFHRIRPHPALRNAADDVRELAARLGPGRDWDVFLAGPAARLAGHFTEDRRMQDLLAQARQARAEAHEGLAGFLASEAWRA